MAKSTTPKPITSLKDGSLSHIGSHEVSYHERGHERLLISFSDQLNDKGYPDRAEWATQISTDRNWSHLQITALKSIWYRDAALIDFFDALSNGKFADQFDAVALVGISMGGFAALSFASYFPKATIIAFSPQSSLKSTLAPWDTRFAGAQALDWSLPGSDAAKTLSKASQVTIIHDPFVAEDKQHVARLKGANVQVLKGFGMQHNVAGHLARMKLFDPVLIATLYGELDPGWFYQNIRNRKNFYFYRVGMETALEARGQSHRIPRFRQAFRQRRQQNDATQTTLDLANQAAQAHPKTPGEWARMRAQSDWPCEPGNVWMLEARGDSLRYLSDRWQGVTMGYEERSGITLAQTPPLTHGIVSFGHGMAVERPLSRRFPWHVTDESLDGTMPAFAAMSEASVQSEYAHADHSGLSHLMAFTAAQSGITATEAIPGGKTFDALIGKLEAGMAALKPWGRRLFVDRVGLSLLAGAPQTTQDDATRHYAQVANALRDRVCQLTGQDSYPFIVVTQSAGTHIDGRSEVILAEGRADLDNPGIDVIVVCPSYPYPLMPGTPATIAPDAALIMDELRYLAVTERQRGREWYCPSLQVAEMSGTTITATFSTLAPLKLGDGVHGFEIEGSGNAVQITQVRVSGDKTVELTCDVAPQGDELMLCYAWGQKADGTENRFANTGALRDAWEQQSRIRPGIVLYRYALAGRTKIVSHGGR